MATNTKLPPPQSASNGVITGPPKGVVGGNRKKQKRRAKQAARSSSNSHPPPLPSGAQAGLDFDEDPLGYGDEDDFDYSDPDHSYDQYLSSQGATNGYSMAPPPSSNNKKKKKKKSSVLQHDYNPELLGNNMPPLPNPPAPSASYQHSAYKPGRDQIWNTSSQQERQNIKEFWLSLSEDERKSLLKIEKEAVLRKMKQQQKHSCSCTVCGRKRTAIEEELEVLYEGYYEELEQYAHHDNPPLPLTDGMVPDPLQHRPHPFATPAPHSHHRTSQLHEHFDDEEYSDEEEDEDVEYSDDEFSDDDIEQIPRNNVPDLFNFGQNLTVKGILTPWLERLRKDSKLNDDVNLDNLLTVADDLLKNDGRKFIEMMEQLAERRMQRESEAEYAAANPSHPGSYPPGDAPYGHDDPLGGDEFDDDEDSYASGEEYDEDMDDEDDMGGLTEEQRMQEGRRMFQIFAARMFEQRVLTAYKEKVAAERQQKLLEELEDESKQEAQREAKKQRDAQKKKDKKRQAQQAKAEEKAKKDAEKAAEEARLKEAEEKKLEEQRRKKEEQRKKKEDEKRKQDGERAKKDAEKARRQQEEQQRREEAERKAREAKAAEKSKKDEARRREREEREAREKEAKERKLQEEKEKKEREDKLRAERDVKQREKSNQASAPPSTQQVPQIQKRPSQPGLVAVPGVYPKQTPSGVSSPLPTVAIPAVPKAPTPAKQRQPSHQGSLASSPKQSLSQVSSVPSKSSSPNSATMQQQNQQVLLPSVQPKTVLQKPANQPSASQAQSQGAPTLSSQPIHPPPGMPYPQQNHPPGFGAMPPIAFHGFQNAQGPMMHTMGQRGPMYQQGPPANNRFGMSGMNGPAPGMNAPQGRGAPFPFDGAGATQPPPGFAQQQHIPLPSNQITPPIGPPSSSIMAPGADAPRPIGQSHSRQQSASEKDRFESAVNQPIQRPAPIQRPSSVKPHGRNGSSADIDDLSAHLGSSALIGDDDDEPMPSSLIDNRRSSNIPVPARSNTMNAIGGGFSTAPAGFGAAPGWNPPGLPFGQSSSLSQQSWGGLSSPSIGSWSNNSAAFPSNTAFGAIGGGHMRPTGTGINRPLTLRLAVCQACKQLDMGNRNEINAYHSVDSLLHQIAGNRTALDPLPTLHEISEICETEGDSQNGGGELARRDGPSADKFSVKWTPDAGTPDPQGRGLAGLGEIGSPMPNKASPASTFGAPGMGRIGTAGSGFPNLGTLGSPSGFQ